ncbi:GtrA family protein [Paenibacillus gorillae]|uniref:GtrA family protein n=1 Tax=Paenibacillus gorillae TaxID=1243662 RepID=UPI0004B59D69|nr:GtrA family protein [Paenibacillus gorillae]
MSADPLDRLSAPKPVDRGTDAVAQVKQIRRKTFKQFILFNMVGVINTAVDFAVYSLLIWAGLHYITGQILSYAAGMGNSYLMNTLITFRGASAEDGGGAQDRGRPVRFIVLNLAVLLISLGLLYLTKEGWGINPFLAKLVVTCITVVLNFVGSKWWVFMRQK